MDYGPCWSQKGLVLTINGLLGQFKGYLEQFLAMTLRDFVNYKQFLSIFITIISSGRYLHLGMFLGQKCPFWAPKNAH